MAKVIGVESLLSSGRHGPDVAFDWDSRGSRPTVALYESGTEFGVGGDFTLLLGDEPTMFIAINPRDAVL